MFTQILRNGKQNAHNILSINTDYTEIVQNRELLYLFSTFGCMAKMQDYRIGLKFNKSYIQI